MKSRWNWVTIPAIAAALTFSTAAQANPNRTPFTTPIQATGTSGGPQSSQCGSISSTPNQVVQVTESAATLRFRVEGQGQPTLLITGGTISPICVMADSRSNGTIEIPGRLQQGTYSVFVGDRSNGSFPYVLHIRQDN